MSALIIDWAAIGYVKWIAVYLIADCYVTITILFIYNILRRERFEEV